MPVIPNKQTVSPAFGTFQPTRRATGEDFDTGGAATRVLAQAGEKIQQAGDALQVSAERDDTLSAQKSIAEIRTKQTLRLQKLQEEGGSGGDLSGITTTATSETDAALSAARSTLTTGKGKRIFDALGADLKSTLVPRAAAVQAHLVGLKAKAQFDETLNTLGTALVSDPSQLQAALQSAEFGIASTPGLSAEARIQLTRHSKEVLTKAAVQGMININPWAAVAALKKGVYDATLKAEDKAPLINAAETQIRARRYDAEAGSAAAARAQRLKDQKLSSDALPRIVDGTITADEILKMDASYSAKVDLLSRMEHYQGKKDLFRGDSKPEVTRDLFSRIAAPPGTPGRIEDQKPLNDAVLAGDISLTHRNFLAQMLQARDNPADQPYGPMTMKFLSTVAPMFNTPYNLPGVSFADRYAVFGQLVFQRIQKAAQEGKNVDELFDPNNKDGLFKMLEQHKPTLIEATRRMADAARAASAPHPGQPGSAPPKAGQVPTQLEKPAQKKGDTVNGRGADGIIRAYRFKGGAPTDPRNYEPVTPPSSLPGRSPALPDDAPPLKSSAPPAILPGMLGR